MLDDIADSGQPAEIAESAPLRLADDFSVHDRRAFQDAGGNGRGQRKKERWSFVATRVSQDVAVGALPRDSPTASRQSITVHMLGKVLPT